MRRGGDVLQQVGSLPVCAVIPAVNLSIGRDDCGAEGVGDESAIRVVGESEIVGELLQLRLRDRRELPVGEESRVFGGGAGESVGAQTLGRVVGGIEADAEKVSFAVARGIGAELAIDGSKLVADAGAEIGERATGVDESQEQRLAAILMQRRVLAVLDDELEIRDLVAGGRDVEAGCGLVGGRLRVGDDFYVLEPVGAVELDVAGLNIVRLNIVWSKNDSGGGVGA